MAHQCFVLQLVEAHWGALQWPLKSLSKVPFRFYNACTFTHTHTPKTQTLPTTLEYHVLLTLQIVQMRLNLDDVELV